MSAGPDVVDEDLAEIEDFEDDPREWGRDPVELDQERRAQAPGFSPGDKRARRDGPLSDTPGA